MPFDVRVLTVPTGAAEVRFADVDGDKKAEILLLSHQPVTGQPDAASLTVIHGDGAVRTVSLGNRPMFLTTAPSIGGAPGTGLWGLGASSWQVWSGDRFVAGAAIASPLGQLGRATPEFAQLTYRIFPGAAARIAWSHGKYLCTLTPAGSATDSSCGSVPAPARGELSATWSEGGQVLATVLTPPPLSVNDADGDGVADLLIPDGKTLAVYYSAAGSTTATHAIGARAASWALPIDLAPDTAPREKGKVRRDVSAVWFDDVDADKRVDLSLLRYVTDGSFFGATAELLYAHGNGAGFAAVQTTPLPSAAFAAQLVDVDGDGDKDVTAVLVDVSMGNLARGLLSHVVRAELSVLRFEAGRFNAPAPIHTVSFPLDSPDGFHVDYSHDIDGDKRIDLVIAESGEVRVDKGTSGATEATPRWSVPMDVPEGDGTLLTADLDNDGRAEVIVWGKTSGKLSILRAR